MIKLKFSCWAANNKGSVLVMTVVFSFAMILLGTAYLRFIEHNHIKTTFEIGEVNSVSAAINAGLEAKYFNPEGGNNIVSDTFYYAGSRDIRYSYIVNDNYDDSLDYGYVSVHGIIGRGYSTDHSYEGQFASEIRNEDSYSTLADYLYLTERECQSYRSEEHPQAPPPADSILRFWGPDTLDGKVHSNDKIKFMQGDGFWPVFYETVSSCSSKFEPEFVVHPPVTVEFLGEPPYRLSAPQICLPVQADSIRKYGLWMGSPDSISELTLEPDGFYYRARLQNGSIAARRNNMNFDFGIDITDPGVDFFPYPDLNAIFVNGECWVTAAKDKIHYNASLAGDSLWLSGFAGRLSIGASGDIIIPQDIKYEDAEGWQVPNNSGNVLGLISEKHILIWRNAPDRIVVQAGLGAIGFKEREEGYDQIPSSRCPAVSGDLIPVDGRFGTVSIDGINCYDWPNEKTQLTIFGCVIQRERGMIHTSVSGERRGYISKRYRYDIRFRVTPPPYFFPISEPGGSYNESLGSLY